jgi:hypothetical protein
VDKCKRIEEEEEVCHQGAIEEWCKNLECREPTEFPGATEKAFTTAANAASNTTAFILHSFGIFYGTL